MRLIPVLVLSLATVMAGCGNLNRTPRYDMAAPLEIQTFKRTTKNDTLDYVYQFKPTAYSPVTKPLTKRLSVSQQDILQRHGQPQWVRRNFTAPTNEKVTEWAWWDRGIIAQFVQGELVYEGPLTDMDRHRIRYGYPRRALSQKYEDGVRRDVWDYQSLGPSAEGMMVTFSDEKLVSEQRY